MIEIRKDAFKILTINETWYCPVKCPYCHITLKASLNDTTKLKTADLVEACNEAQRLRFHQYRFSGGEPTILGETLFEHARIVQKITKKKPVLLTSGYAINENWCSQARGLFSGIYISLKRAVDHSGTAVDQRRSLRLLRDFSSENLPLRLGVTLVFPEDYYRLYNIFARLYEETNQQSFPQITSPSIKDFGQPTATQLEHLTLETEKIFANYGVVPYYFSDFIGSLLFLNGKMRYVVNLNPNGSFWPFSSISDALEKKISLRKSIIKEKDQRCRDCQWRSYCMPFDGGIIGKIPYFDLCNMRKAIYQGIERGLQAFEKGESEWT